MVDAEAPAPVSEPPATAAPAPKAASKSTNKSAAKAPTAELPSEEERTKLLVELAAEAADLRARGLSLPLIKIPAETADSDAGSAITQQVYSDAVLAEHIVGQRLPLKELAEALQPLFKRPEGAEGTLTADKLSLDIVNVAVRKSHDPVDNPKSGAAGTTAVDPLTAGGTGDGLSMWQWELRDNKLLSKAQRAQSVKIKRRAGKVCDRLSAATAAQDALDKLKIAAIAPGKAARALEALRKYETLEQILASEEAEVAAAAEKAAAKANQAVADAEEKKKAKDEEKEKLRLEKEAEKERIRLEKEEEKAKKEEEKAKKEEEKERQRQEREKKHQEAEAARLAKKTGFKDEKALKKTSNKFLVSVKV